MLVAHTPMCLNVRRILLAEAPAISMLKLRATFPAGYFVHMSGSDLHLNAPSPHSGQLWMAESGFACETEHGE